MYVPAFLPGEFHGRDIVAVNEESLKDKHMTECIMCWKPWVRDSIEIQS